MDFTEDVRPVSDLRRKAHQMVARARKSRKPMLITQRGRSAAVLVAVEEWEEREARRELLEAILRGERDFSEARVVEEKDALARILKAARD
jgi:antitoxin YefM